MADPTPNTNEPKEITLDPIQPATPAEQALPTQPPAPTPTPTPAPAPTPTPATPAEQALPTQPPVAEQPTFVPQPIPTPATPAEQALPTQPPVAEQPTPAPTPATSLTDQVLKFKLYIIIFASIVGLATIGYVTYSFFFSGTSTPATPPPTVASPFEESTPATTETTEITSEKTEDVSPPSLGGETKSSSSSQNSEFGKTVQDIKDASTSTDKVYDNAVLEETTISTGEVTKKVPR